MLNTIKTAFAFRPFAILAGFFVILLVVFYINNAFLKHNLAVCETEKANILLQIKEAKIEALQNEIKARRALDALNAEYELKIEAIEGLKQDENRSDCANAIAILRRFF